MEEGDPTLVKNIETKGSRIFSSLRMLGQVSGFIPCQTRYIHRRRENFIITAVGRNFHTFASQKLQLLTTSGSMPEDITCLAVDTYHVYTGAGNKIYAWRRGFEIKHVYKYDVCVKGLLAYPPQLISLHLDGTIIVWDVVSEECKTSINLTRGNFTPAVLFHPATYINKILVGSEEGSMILLNIRTSKIIHEFQSFNSKINQITQTPAIDIVAIALEDRRILLHNLRFDETIMKFNALEETISLAFRLDGSPIMICGSLHGSITLWDLETKELVSHIEKAHDGPVHGIQSFPQEPIFVTSSSDNSIKVWIFDMPDGSFRLLNRRDGHAKPSNRVRFFGKSADTKYILSSSSDASFRMFHIYNETYNRNLASSKILTNGETKLGKNHVLYKSSKKMNTIMDFTTQTVTAPSHHADIAAAHEDQLAISTWSFANTKKGEKVLIHPKYQGRSSSVNVRVTCLTMTSCCQFVIAGYDDGTVERFNIQSGIHRKTYGNPAHVDKFGTACIVRGVAVNQMNTIVLSGATDATLKFWDFKTAKEISQIILPTNVELIFHRTTDYFAGIVGEDYGIYVINFNSKSLFRRLLGATNPVLDASFSPDNLWVTASTADCIIRTWDLTTGNLIDAVRLDSIVKSLDYSPTGEHLAGSYCDKTGIFIWSNRTLYENVSLMPLPLNYEPPEQDMAVNEQIIMEPMEIVEYESPEQIKKNLITLSQLPESRWKNLLNLDTIKMRNRPKQPPKNYVAPFFLSTMTSLTTENDNTTVINKENESSNATKILKSSISELDLTPFGKKLKDSDVSNHFVAYELMKSLEEMGPSKIDMEIRGLGPDTCNSLLLLKKFSELMYTVIEGKQHYENTQAYLALFLKIHGETLYEETELNESLEKLKSILHADYVQDKINKILSYISYLKTKLQ